MRLHTESGYGLRTGLWPKSVLPHAAKTPSPTTTAASRKPVETEKIHPDTANGADVKTQTAIGLKPVCKPFNLILCEAAFS